MQEKRRKRIFPTFEFQKRLFFCLFGTGVLVVIFCGAYLLDVLEHGYFDSVRNVALSPAAVSSLITEFNTARNVVFGALFFILVGFAWLGLLYTNAIGGLFFALQRTCKELEEGKNVQLKVRKNEGFDEVADAFNRMLNARVLNQGSST